jgi:signal transduction histidine kinase
LSKSLRWKFVVVILLMIVLLMTVVCVFLIQGVQSFYTKEFNKQMTEFFKDEKNNKSLHEQLVEGDRETTKENLKAWLIAYQGKLGINSGTRNGYILDGIGNYLMGSNTDNNNSVTITPNLLRALNGRNDSFAVDVNAAYMDVAVPVSDRSGAVQYIIYIRDDKQTVYDLNMTLVELILKAVAVGLVLSVILSFILSKTLLQPIIGMTKAAEAIAEGDFSKKLSVESGDEIGILADTFNNMATQLQITLEEIKKSEALRREFVANVSHELRTPLTSIRSYAETLTDYRDIPKEMEVDFLHVILNESERMTKIVQDLLELSRFDAGNAKLAVEKFSLEEAVRNVCDAIALEARKHGHQLRTEIDSGLPTISGDKARIEQVFINILSNAVKYTPDGGSINITGGRTGAKVWIKIRDTGIGIPEADLSRIFDRFYRVDKARSRESGGTGLGLSIAREIVQRHGGDILIESAVGAGTTVTVVLPIEGTNREEV